MLIARISRVVADLDAAETFYRDALGFRTIGKLPRAQEAVMQLGDDVIALVQPRIPGRPYPADSASNDLWFQHLAIVVSDMDAAYAHLSRFAPRTISRDGPVLLPPANNSVRAVKFRDPDGHPLELIWFPPGQGRPVWRTKPGLFMGIDHSALAVASTSISLPFYQSLGLQVTAQSTNQGPAQSELDGLTGAHVHVIGLRPDSDEGPGLELLAYDPPGRPAATRPGDIAADWVTLKAGGIPARVLTDPDGHQFLLV